MRAYHVQIYPRFKMKTLPKILVGIAALAASLQARANIIVALTPDSQTVNTGDHGSLDLVVSGLGDHTSPSLGAFLFDFSYDPAVISVDSISFGSHLGLGLLGSLQIADISSPGNIHLDEISLESASDLQASQPSSFTLATLGFRGLAPGTSSVDFTFGSLADESGQISLEFLSQPATITVADQALIPDTGPTAALLCLAVAGLLAFRAGSSSSGRI